MSDEKKYPYVAFNPFGNPDVRVVVRSRSYVNEFKGGNYTSRYYTLEVSRGKNAMGDRDWFKMPLTGDGLNDPELRFLAKSYIEQKLDEIEVPMRSEDE